MLRLLAACAALLATPALAHDGPHVSDPYAVVTGASATTAAVFFVIENHGHADDALIGVTTDVADKAEIHTHTMDANGVMSMGALERIDVPAHATHPLARGGDHIMLLGLKKPLAEGDTFTLILTFARGNVVTIDVPVDAKHVIGSGPSFRAP